jgi:hypothetical protein
LLTSLQASTVKVRTTCNSDGIDSRTVAFEGLLVWLASGPRPNLGLIPLPAQFIPAPAWWEQIVLISPGKRWRRRDLTLSAANKDGGAHVDPDLTPEYQRLTKGLWEISGYVEGVHVAGAITDHQFMYLRQMGWEVLNSPDLVALAAA